MDFFFLTLIEIHGTEESQNHSILISSYLSYFVQLLFSRLEFLWTRKEGLRNCKIKKYSERKEHLGSKLKQISLSKQVFTYLEPRDLRTKMHKVVLLKQLKINFYVNSVLHAFIPIYLFIWNIILIAAFILCTKHYTSVSKKLIIKAI